MDEQKPRITGLPRQDDEEFVRHLLESAGPRPPIEAADLQAISAAARAAWQEKVRPRTRWSRFRPALALAASIALVTLGFTLWWNTRGSMSKVSAGVVDAVAGPVSLLTGSDTAHLVATGEAIPLGATLASGSDAGSQGRTSIHLPDGTVIRLDVGTRVRFAQATVLELQKGALYADTGSTKGHALEVRTSAGIARDIGTQFVVRVGGTGPAELQVLVRKGSVAVEQRGHTITTTAGHRLSVAADGTSAMQEVATHGSEWEWIMESTAGFPIEGRSLEDFLDWVTRETGWRIQYADDALATSAKGIILHGAIGELRADRAPFVVLPGAGLDAELKDGTLLIRRSR